MKIKITLTGEGCCSTIKECSEEQYKFLSEIVQDMGDYEYESYSPIIHLEEIKDE